MIRSGNPTLGAFQDTARWDELAIEKAEHRAKHMTLGGTLTAFGVLLGICVATAMVVWQGITSTVFGVDLKPFAGALTFGGAIVGLLLALPIIFMPKAAPFLSPFYALVEGAFLAGFSYFVASRWLGEDQATGLIFQAIGVTFGIAGGMLGAYAFGLIRISGTVAKVMVVAISGLVLYSLAIMIGNGLLGLGIPNLYASASPLGIGFTAICVVLASLFLVLDFQQIEAGIKGNAPKHMEWYAAFGLMVTLIWLYMEVLRLLAKLRGGE